MEGNIYLDLIRVFYTNLKFEGNNFVSLVKGVDMEISHEVWTTVTVLKYAGLRIKKGKLVWWKTSTKFNITKFV